MTDKAKEVVPSHYEQLKALEWMVGQWTSDADNAEVELDCNWTKNQNFLTRAFKISIDGDTSSSGMQIIGWDPAAKAIRSWTFDSNGTFAEATWEQNGGRWFIRNRGTLARWSCRNHDQRDEAGRRQLVHLANDRTHGGGRTASQY